MASQAGSCQSLLVKQPISMPSSVLQTAAVGHPAAIRPRQLRARPCGTMSAAAPSLRLPTTCQAGKSDGSGMFSDKKKEAARQALEAALGGKKDILADFDKRAGGGDDGGSGGGGGGGGGSGGGGFNFGDFWKDSKDTILAFGGVVFLVMMLVSGRQIVSFIFSSIATLARGGKKKKKKSKKRAAALEDEAAGSTAPKPLGSYEEQAIAKWGDTGSSSTAAAQ